MKFICLIVLLLIQLKVNAETLKITFVVPDEKTLTFWHLVSDVARSVAEDVDVELDVVYSDNNRFASKIVLEKIALARDKPDYLIFRPFQGNSLEIFNLLESQGIPFVTLEQAFTADEAKLLGVPQQKFKHWLGAINYDNEAGGKLLTQALHTRFKALHPDKPFYITGIGGDFDAVSMERQTYLEQYFKANEHIIVNQIFPMYWRAEAIEERFADIHQRYPQTNAYWCAGDNMALAVSRQLSKLGKQPGQQVLIGGFDWLPTAIEKIHSGEMTASVGGHFLMTGTAILNIIEYHHGNNAFINHPQREKYELIDQTNVDDYLPFLQQAPWSQVDFAQFSASKNTHKTSVKLTVANLFKAFSEQSSQPTKRAQ
jgi:ABC-type sugar transport system substrate-binding protein